MERYLLLVGLFVLSSLAYSQNYFGVVVSHYTVEQNKKVNETLRNERIVFTCIPSGILVFEFPNDLNEFKQKIGTVIKTTGNAEELVFIENYSIESAELACATTRKLD